VTEPTTQSPAGEATEIKVQTAIEVAVRLGAIALLVGWCLQIVAPFVGIVIWALIIAIAAETPYEKLRGLLGGRGGLAASAGVILALLLIFVPAIMLTETLVSGAHGFAADLADGKLEIPPPPPTVADWPVVGKQLFAAWQLASENLTEALEKAVPQLEALSRWLLSAAGSAGVGMLQLVASLLIAGVMLTRSPGRRSATQRFATRLAGKERGIELAELATATVQSVVQGIVGVALIQAVLAGLGLIVAGIPGAGLWALIVLVAAVVQIPVALALAIPVVVAFSSLGTVGASIFAAWCIVVSLLDNVLKPILFGRGVNVPTVVIFLGAIGGMLSMGIIGLFLGAVVLALGFELFRAWLATPEGGIEAASARE
jgi:predicted PurR-regulated permease PerM